MHFSNRWIATTIRTNAVFRLTLAFPVHTGAQLQLTIAKDVGANWAYMRVNMIVRTFE